MEICKFYLQGNCKFGDTCRNEHPSRNQRSASQNPFGPSQGTTSSSTRDNRTHPYNINASNVKLDLLNERPQWILSSYAPGRDAPIQLFGGLPREQSFEEMRLRHYELAAQGRQQEAMQEARSLVENAEYQIRIALQDIDGAIKYVLDGANQHPNRIDICKSNGSNSQSNQSMAPPTSIPLASSSNRPTFGQQSAIIQTGSAFAQPSFPTSSQTMQSGFGPQSTLGNTPQGLQTNSNPFQRNSSSGPSNPFAAQTTSSPLNPFATTSMESKATTSSGGFSNPFARNDNSTAGAGSQNQGFTQTNSGFGLRNDAGRTQPNISATASSNQSMPAAAQIQKDSQGNLRSWNGRPVSYRDEKPFYRDSNGQHRRIWFPDGPPLLSSLESLPDEVYNESTKNDYAFLRAEGHFNDGLVPVIPPKKDWCDWNV